MKTKFFVCVLALLASSGAVANAIDPSMNPENFCNDVRCTQPMREVIRDYALNPGVPNLAQAPWLSTGECWHIHPNLSADTTHHALFLFENGIAGPTVNGFFSFFVGRNQYAGVDLETARARLRISGGAPSPIQIYPEHVGWTHSGETSELLYWVRVNENTGETFLITRWMFFGQKGADLRTFCRLQKHSIAP